LSFKGYEFINIFTNYFLALRGSKERAKVQIANVKEKLRTKAQGKGQKFISKSNAKVKTRNIFCSIFKSSAKRGGAKAKTKSQTHV
jgi:uncharacterized protein YcgL (UPF0745 family)